MVATVKAVGISQLVARRSNGEHKKVGSATVAACCQYSQEVKNTVIHHVALEERKYDKEAARSTLNRIAIVSKSMSAETGGLYVIHVTLNVWIKTLLALPSSTRQADTEALLEQVVVTVWNKVTAGCAMLHTKARRLPGAPGRADPARSNTANETLKTLATC